jgi:hypothetical protein
VGLLRSKECSNSASAPAQKLVPPLRGPLAPGQQDGQYRNNIVKCATVLTDWRCDMMHGGSAYRAALEEYTRDRVQLKWARTQHALRALGEREKGTARLKQAVGAYDLALSNFASPGLEHYSQTCRADRDRAVAALKQRLGPDWDRHAAE